MTAEELKTILALHAKWLQNEEGGERADLREAKLSGANLYVGNIKVKPVEG